MLCIKNDEYILSSLVVCFAECTSNCLTCYFDTDGVNLCQECEQRYALSSDSKACNRKCSLLCAASALRRPDNNAFVVIAEFRR